MKFRVVIEDWNRGGTFNTVLFNGDGKRCCLGFAAKDLGVPDGEMKNKGNPFAISGEHRAKVEGILCVGGKRYTNTDFAASAIIINDNPDITDTERMRRLRALAKEHGHQFVFVHKK